MTVSQSAVRSKQRNHELTSWLCFCAFFIITFICAVYGSIQNTRLENELAQAKQETASLRSQITNHLLAENFFDKPAKEVMPVVKRFGINY